MKRFSAEWFKERISVSCFNVIFIPFVGAIILILLVLACADSSSGPCVLMQSVYRTITGEDPSIVVEQIPTQAVPTQPVPSAASSPCPSGPPSRLNAGDKAIQLKPGRVNLRTAPDPDGDNIIGEIEKCEFLTILEGPTCGDGYNLYRVRHGVLGEGWAAEADPGRHKYWLVPVLDDRICNLPPVFVEGEIAISDHPSSGFIREAHALSAPTLAWNIIDGDTVKILDGPVCNDTYIWYKVKELNHPNPGWTELGEGSDYWFEIPARFEETNVKDADASC